MCAVTSVVAANEKAFAEIQAACGAVEHKMMKPCQTRWLCRRQVIRRVLEQGEPLRLFFTEEATNNMVKGWHETQTFISSLRFKQGRG